MAKIKLIDLKENIIYQKKDIYSNSSLGYIMNTKWNDSGFFELKDIWYDGGYAYMKTHNALIIEKRGLLSIDGKEFKRVKMGSIKYEDLKNYPEEIKKLKFKQRI